MKIYDDSLIIVTSDRGQALIDNKFNYYGHNHLLFDELVEVPLMIKLPKNKKFPVRGGYQSLTKLNKFIVDVIEGNYEEDNITDEVVYSEIRGIREVEDKDFYNQQSQTNGKKILDAFADRKAIYKGGYKCVVTGRSGQVEEFTKHGKEVDSNNILLKDLLTPLQDFSTTARDDFTINL